MRLISAGVTFSGMRDNGEVLTSGKELRVFAKGVQASADPQDVNIHTHHRSHTQELADSRIRNVHPECEPADVPGAERGEQLEEPDDCRDNRISAAGDTLPLIQHSAEDVLSEETAVR